MLRFHRTRTSYSGRRSIAAPAQRAFETRLPEQWGVELNAFSQRNAGRRIELQSSYPKLAAETLETGFALLGTVYDPHDEVVELMFGNRAGSSNCFTRGIRHIHALTVNTTEGGVDVGLRIDHRDGATS